jgi:hypothetical protein
MIKGTNPLEQYFAHALGPNTNAAGHRVYDAKDVMILWNDVSRTNMQVCDVAVAYHPVDLLDSLTTDQRVMWDKWQNQFENSHGNCIDMWMMDPRYTPECLFGKWVFVDHFAGPDEHLRAVLEFAKIRECDWVRRMLLGVRE